MVDEYADWLLYVQRAAKKEESDFRRKFIRVQRISFREGKLSEGQVQVLDNYLPTWRGESLYNPNSLEEYVNAPLLPNLRGYSDQEINQALHDPDSRREFIAKQRALHKKKKLTIEQRRVLDTVFPEWFDDFVKSTWEEEVENALENRYRREAFLKRSLEELYLGQLTITQQEILDGFFPGWRG